MIESLQHPAHSHDGMLQRLALCFRFSPQRFHRGRKRGLQVSFGFGVGGIDSYERNPVSFSFFV